MPVNWEIRNSVVIVTLTGHYSFQEPVQAVTEAMAAPRFRAGMALLIDARCSTSSRSSDEFRERAWWMASLASKGLSTRFAIVINSEPHQFGLARMAEIHLDIKGLELEIFTDLDDALQWLERAGTTNAPAR
jgi:hypothetical protein